MLGSDSRSGRFMFLGLFKLFMLYFDFYNSGIIIVNNIEFLLWLNHYNKLSFIL